MPFYTLRVRYWEEVEIEVEAESVDDARFTFEENYWEYLSDVAGSSYHDGYTILEEPSEIEKKDDRSKENR